jgi:hypothetical protein
MTWMPEPLQALAAENVLIGTSSWKSHRVAHV